MMTR
ncbi:unnamed protein product [Linum tenue]